MGLAGEPENASLESRAGKKCLLLRSWRKTRTDVPLPGTFRTPYIHPSLQIGFVLTVCFGLRPRETKSKQTQSRHADTGLYTLNKHDQQHFLTQSVAAEITACSHCCVQCDGRGAGGEGIRVTEPPTQLTARPCQLPAKGHVGAVVSNQASDK